MIRGIRQGLSFCALSALVPIQALAQSYIDLPWVLANAMSTNGTANQCWGMDPTGAFQQWITPAGGGGSGVTTMGTFGSTPNSSGGSIATTTLTLQPADGSNPGGVSTAAQTFAGNKTFSGIIAAGGGSVATGGAINLKAQGTGTAQSINLTSSDGLITWNIFGRSTSGGQLFFYDGSSILMLMQGPLTGIGPSAPIFHMDVNKADPNTVQTSPGVSTVAVVRNTDPTANNLSTWGMANSANVMDVAIEAVHVTNSASFASKLELLTGKGGVLAVHQEITQDGQINYKGTAPAVSACGSSPSIVGNDVTGRVTVGTGGVATSCTVTFNATWTNAPICVANNETTTLLARASATATVLTITSASAFTASDTIGYRCFGYL